MTKDDLDVPVYELKIESGVGGGSISLDRNKEKIDEWVGHSFANRNDYLIENLSQLLERSNIRISAISRITYSDNPGSQTGLRIIISIIKGLSAAHNIGIIGKNLFESIAEFYSVGKETEMIIVLPVKSDVFEFAKYIGQRKIAEGRFESLEELGLKLEKLNNDNFAVFIPFKISDTFESVKNSKSFPSAKIFDLGENLSIYL